MIIKNKLKQICLDKNMTLAELANMYGMETKAFYVKLNRNSMSFDTAEQIMDVLDCDVVFKDRKTGKEY